MVPASFDFCLANLNREASSAGTSIPSESLNPTALLGVVDGVHHVARQTALVEDIGHSDVLDLEGRSLILVLEVAGLVRPQTSERARDGR